MAYQVYVVSLASFWLNTLAKSWPELRTAEYQLPDRKIKLVRRFGEKMEKNA